MSRSRGRLWSIPVVALAAVGLATSPSSRSAAPAAPVVVQVAAEVRSVIESGGAADFAVEFRDRADLSKAWSIRDWAERGRFVVDALRATTERSQREATADLSAKGTTFSSYWVNNSIIVRHGDAKALSAVTSKRQVAAVRALQTMRVPQPQQAQQTAAAGVEWGVAEIRADQVWSTFGVRGQGVVVGAIDTGVQFDHPALAASYRGRNPDGTVTHDHNWFDPSWICPSAAPCDNNSHGTHTMGTIVGDGGPGAQIGVAPGAKWITAKGCESGSCSQQALLAAGEWMLAPTDLSGQHADPALRPHVVSNSWGGPGLGTVYQPMVDAWRAAGMFPVFANGNEGPACGSVGSPGSLAGSFGVGAYDQAGKIASFSGRGPGPDGGTKPNISAPGVNVRSAVPGPGYAAYNGTSMATPHVAGAVALVLSRSVALRGNLADTAQLLEDTARDVEDLQCGGNAADNNVFGEGKLDALAAVAGAPEGPAGHLTGTVADQASGAPVGNATVTIGERRTLTDSQGRYTLLVDAGDRTLRTTAYGYRDDTRTVTVPANGTLTVDIGLSALPAYTLTGTVRDGGVHGWPVYAKVEPRGRPGSRVYTDPATGRFSIRLPEGAETLLVSSPLYRYAEIQRPVTVGADIPPVDLALLPGCDAVGYDPYFCQPPPPYGLIVGHVRSAVDGKPIDGASVVAGNGGPWEFTDSRPTPDDPALDDGFFRLVAPPGSRQLTVTKNGYPVATVPVEVTAGEVTVAEVRLDAARLTVTGAGLDATVPFGEQANGTITLTNSGTVSTTVRLVERARLDTSAGTRAGVMRVPVQVPERPNRLGAGGLRPASPASGTAAPPGAGWEQVKSLGSGIIGQGTAAVDGIIYAVGGATELNPNSYAVLDVNSLLAYDPTTDTWSYKAGMRYGRWAPAVAAINGLIYAAGGWDYEVVDSVGSDGELNNDLETAPGLEIYDPGSNRWTTRVGPPAVHGHTTGVALDGKFYVIGGEDIDGSTSADVFRYDPAADAWTRLAAYPTGISHPICGPYEGAVYCAGGSTRYLNPSTSAFRYNPAINAWTPLAELPVGLAEGSGTMAAGRLIVTGGLVRDGNSVAMTNEGYAYDPAAGTWAPIPPAPRPTFAASVACGLYRFGGYSADTGRMDTRAERLPGLDSCGSGDLPWLFLENNQVTIAPGQTSTVRVALRSAPLAGPGTSLGSVAVIENTPDVVDALPVTLRVTDSAAAAQVAVSVGAVGRCGTALPAPAGSTVTVRTPAYTRTVRAKADGTARVWALPGEGRATVTSTAPSYRSGSVSGLRLRAGQTTSVGLTLRQTVACTTVGPQALSITVAAGQTGSATLTLGNTGTIGYEATLGETPEHLRARPAGTSGVGQVTSAPLPPPSPAGSLPPGWYRTATDYPDTGQPNGIRLVGCDGRPDVLTAMDYQRAFTLNPARGTWDGTPPYLAPAHSPAIVCDLDEIHQLGGFGYIGPDFSHTAYNTTTRQWRSRASMPTGAAAAAAGVWDGKIFVAGGYTEGVAGMVQVYDKLSNTWLASTPAPMPVPVWGAGYTQQGHHLYVVGGYSLNGSTPVAATQRLDMITGGWQRGPDLSQARTALGLVATDTALYALGGLVSGTATTRVDRLPVAGWSADAWQPIDPLPAATYAHYTLGVGCTQSLTGGELWLVGGRAVGSDGKTALSRAAYFRPLGGERCDTIAADVDWLSTSTMDASVSPDSTITIDVTVDAGSLAPGTHHATLLLRTTDPGATEIRIPVTVTVTG